MKTHTPSQHERLCLVIRTLRQLKQIKAHAMAEALGYKNESGYCKMERGQTNDISFWRLLKICQLLKCSLFQLCFLADVNILLGGSITTWKEFNQSLTTLSADEKQKLIAIAQYLRYDEFIIAD